MERSKPRVAAAAAGKREASRTHFLLGVAAVAAVVVLLFMDRGTRSASSGHAHTLHPSSGGGGGGGVAGNTGRAGKARGTGDVGDELLLSQLLDGPVLKSEKVVIATSSSIPDGSGADIELFVQQPSQQLPLGMLWLFHGCNHNGEDWFTLPAERKVLRAALQRGLVVVAMSSNDRTRSRCWDETDVPRFVVALLSLRASHGLAESLPLYALGASSGGMFVNALALASFGKVDVDFDAIALAKSGSSSSSDNDNNDNRSNNNNNSGNNKNNVYRDKNSSGTLFRLRAIAQYVAVGDLDMAAATLPPAFPATAYIYMTKDFSFASAGKVAAAQRILRSHSIRTASFAAGPFALEPEVVHDYIDYVNMAFARAFCLRMRTLDALTADKMLKKDPRRDDRWEEALKYAFTSGGSKHTAPDQGVVIESFREVVNMMWATHEMTGQFADEVVTFLLE